MGAWGTGLYSSDFAQDLRGTVAAVARLPFEPARLLHFLCEAEPSVSNDNTDSDHTSFWLVVADQFVKRGIDCLPVWEKALAIIKDGADLAAMAALGMDEKALAKRGLMLAELQTRVSRPPQSTKPRAVLKAPQKLLLDVGEVLIYPTCSGTSINPYLVGKGWDLVKAWKQDGWGAFTVADRGLAFGFLAWYWPLIICEALPSEPTIDGLLKPLRWQTANAGTLTARHYKNLQLKSIGRISCDAGKVTHLLGRCTTSVRSAVSDISLSNSLHLRNSEVHEASLIRLGYPPTPKIHALGEILHSGGD
jgi:hypothetical protein